MTKKRGRTKAIRRSVRKAKKAIRRARKQIRKALRGRESSARTAAPIMQAIKLGAHLSEKKGRKGKHRKAKKAHRAARKRAHKARRPNRSREIMQAMKLGASHATKAFRVAKASEKRGKKHRKAKHRRGHKSHEARRPMRSKEVMQAFKLGVSAAKRLPAAKAAEKHKKHHRKAHKSREAFGWLSNRSKSPAAGRSSLGAGRGLTGLRERGSKYKEYLPRASEFFGSREMAPLGIRTPNVGTFWTDVVKPSLWAAGGLVGTRFVVAVAKRVGLDSLTAKLPTVLQPVLPTAVAAGAAWFTWWITGKSKMMREHRTLIAIGAGLAVVEEALAAILPRVLPASLQGGIVGEAVYGGALAGTDNGMGTCFTGTCPTAWPGWQPDGQPLYTGQQPACSGAAPGQQGMGNCFTGACPGNGPGCTGSGPQCCGCPPQNPGMIPPPAFVPPTVIVAAPGGAPTPGGSPKPAGTATAPAQSGFGLAGSIAVDRSGIADPVVQGILAGMSGRAQQLMDQVGYRG